MEKLDYRFKFVIVGDSSVGKSSLVLQYADNVFREKNDQTIGIDFRSKRINVDGHNIVVYLWDTAGQERFKTITTSYYRGSHAMIFAFDLTNRESFDNIKKWYDTATYYNPTCQKILVGTKCDRTDRQVNHSDIVSLCSELSMNYVETSSKENIRIDEVITTVCSKLLILHENEKIIAVPEIDLTADNQTYFQSYWSYYVKPYCRIA